MNAVELFAGAGGLSVGLSNAGFNVVLANEIEPDFAQSFRLNHPQTTLLQKDICAINFEKEATKIGLSEVDLVSGGPPCQGFSTVGAKNPSDPRNRLFYEYLRVVEELSPSFVLFENVAGFKTMYNGVAYNTLIQSLDTLGYDTQSAVLDASDFGLPQIRQRTIIVGWKKSLPPIAMPIPTHGIEGNLFLLPKKRTLIEAISDLPPLTVGQSADEYLSAPQNEYQTKMRGHCVKLTDHNVAHYGEKMQEILSLIPYGGSVNDLPMRLRPQSYFSNTYARLLADKPTPTLTRNFGTPSSSRCVHPYQNRALSTREGSRLQGFPDSYFFYGSKISKNLQIGNAVSPIFGDIIAKEIILSLKKMHPVITPKKTILAPIML